MERNRFGLAADDPPLFWRAPTRQMWTLDIRFLKHPLRRSRTRRARIAYLRALSELPAILATARAAFCCERATRGTEQLP
jgi:hypothetical protein